MKYLLVTVGGSFYPVCTAITTLAPDRVIFICTSASRSQVDGPGAPCEVRRGVEVLEKRANIVTQLDRNDSFIADDDVVQLEDGDNLFEVYHAVGAAIQKRRKIDPAAEFFADYTGATKTMSSGLLLAALDWDIPLYVTSAERRNIIRVDSGETTFRAAAARTQIERFLLHGLPELFEQFAYPAILTAIRRLFSKAELERDHQRRLLKVFQLCRGRDAWDRFDHLAAWESLNPFLSDRELSEHVRFLKRILSSRETVDAEFRPPDREGGHGYEIVEDLLLNAERRARSERFDDAVGRMYRALELTAQIRLKTAFGIETGNVAPNQVPNEFRSAAQGSSKLQLGLWQAWLILETKDPPELRALFQQRKNRILHLLDLRNNSLFAHGFDPISQEAFQNVSGVWAGFLADYIAAVPKSKPKKAPSQFPRKIPSSWT